MSIRGLLLATLAGVSFVASAATKLGPGEQAPPLPVYRWVKGTPIKQFDKGKVYVVEFWATWCGPCKVSIPHLTELAKKFAGKVTFAGISIAESPSQQPGGTDISYIPKVAQFVKSEGAEMAYNVGVDGPTGSTNRNWMVAAGQEGIPTAFIIGREGKVMWIGHPMFGLDEAIGQVLNGTFDLAAEKARESKEADATAADAGKAEILQAWGEAMQEKDWSAAVKAADDALASHPELKNDLIPARFEALARLDVPAANKYAKSLEEGTTGTNAALLNEIAWTMVDDSEPLSGMDYSIAEELATKAVHLCKAESSDFAETLDTVALAEYKNGKVKEAIDNEEKVIALYKKVRPKDLETLKEMKGRLAEFRSRKV